MDAAVKCNMCRICMRLVSKRLLIGLFEHIVQTESLAKVVSLVGAVEVQQDDELPKLCCTQCLREVEAAYKLRTLCQESDVKLRIVLPNKAAAAVVKNETFSDDELSLQDPQGPNSSDPVLAQEEVKKLHLLTPDTIKHEYEEITIEETRIIDTNYSELDQRSGSKHSISEDDEESSSNNQELETDVSHNKPPKKNWCRLPRILDKFQAVNLGCCGCISSFDTIEDLQAHGREKHCDTDLESFTLKKRQCDICFKVFFNRVSYDFHKKIVMYNYRCKICDQILITLKQALSHCRLKHAQRKLSADQVLICCGCKKRFSSAEALRNHCETIHLPEKPPRDEKKPVTCNICYSNHSSKRALRTHKIGYLLQCKECGKSFSSLLQLRHHEQSHTRQTTYSCSQCSKKYFHYSSFRRHIHKHSQRNSQPSDRHRCEECGRSFRNNTLLTAHSRCHIGARPFSCQQCPATFKRKHNLTAHIITHDDQMRYQCPQCDRRFKSASGRNGHIRLCHN